MSDSISPTSNQLKTDTGYTPPVDTRETAPNEGKVAEADSSSDNVILAEAKILGLDEGRTTTKLPSLQEASRRQVAAFSAMIDLTLSAMDVVGMTGLELTRYQQKLTEMMSVYTDMLGQMKIMKGMDIGGVLATDEDEAKSALDSLNTNDLTQYRDGLQQEKSLLEDKARTTQSYATGAQNALTTLSDTATANLATEQTINRSLKTS